MVVKKLRSHDFQYDQPMKVFLHYIFNLSCSVANKVCLLSNQVSREVEVRLWQVQSPMIIFSQAREN